jgi:hypothetical protein
MEEYQSKKSLLPRLTAENVVTKEDEDALSSALGGTARLVPRKQGLEFGFSLWNFGDGIVATF